MISSTLSPCPSSACWIQHIHPAVELGRPGHAHARASSIATTSTPLIIPENGEYNANHETTPPQRPCCACYACVLARKLAFQMKIDTTQKKDKKNWGTEKKHGRTFYTRYALSCEAPSDIPPAHAIGGSTGCMERAGSTKKIF